MMNNEQKREVGIILEEQLMNIEENKLPDVFGQRLELIEKTNRAYEEAKRKEKLANDAVSKALTNAEDFIGKAKGVGSHRVKERKFLWHEWTKKTDEITVLRENLKEIIEHGEQSAIAQKELAEVQKALLESQTALLKVQETQMAYQGQIANATKFLYGLCAYNTGQLESIIINLKARLSGASEEKLGEMALQQMFLAMDQIKNQESILLKVQENKELIESLDLEVGGITSKIEGLVQSDKEQDVEIDDLQEKDKEHESKIKDLEEADEEQDAEIDELKKADEEQDAQIDDLQEKDKEHESKIKDLEEADEEQDAEIDELKKADEEQDAQIDDLQEKDKEHDSKLKYLEKADEEQDALLEELKNKDFLIEKLVEENSLLIQNLQEKINFLENEKMEKKVGYFTLIAAGVAVVLSLIQFVI